MNLNPFLKPSHTGVLTLGVVKLLLLALHWWRWGSVVLLVWRAWSCSCNKTKSKQQRKSLKSVSCSETDVTANLSSFIELLVQWMTHKRSVKQWMDPRGVWGQNEGLWGAGKQRKWVMGYIQKGALPWVIPVLSSLKKMGIPGSGKPTDYDEWWSNNHTHKKLNMISSKEEDHLHW